jgi:DNA gyrase subunit A
VPHAADIHIDTRACCVWGGRRGEEALISGAELIVCALLYHLRLSGDLNEMDLLANESSIIVVTQAGYIKRMPLSIFDAQSRGTRGKAGAKMAGEDDGVVHFLTCRDHDTLLVISSRGVAYGLRAYQVPAASRTARGVPVPQVVPLSSDDGISSVIPVESFPDDEYLVLLSQKGYIKKTSLAAFEHLTARGLTITSLGEGDELLKVKRCTDKDSVMVATRKGHAIRFSTSQSKLRATGRTRCGRRGPEC